MTFEEWRSGWLSRFKGQTPIVCPQEAAGEGIPILLLGNKMDMDGQREVSFKEAEKVAQVGLLPERGCPRTTSDLLVCIPHRRAR